METPENNDKEKKNRNLKSAAEPQANSDDETERKHLLEGRLKDFLRQTPADDFEREALEGFSLLGNDEDILAAKKDLDQRMQPVLAREKKSRVYWYAAAALLIVCGFSIFIL